MDLHNLSPRSVCVHKPAAVHIEWSAPHIIDARHHAAVSKVDDEDRPLIGERGEASSGHRAGELQLFELEEWDRE